MKANLARCRLSAIAPHVQLFGGAPEAIISNLQRELAMFAEQRSAYSALGGSKICERLPVPSRSSNIAL